MDFTKAYDRAYFLNFLRNNFLPEDFKEDTRKVVFNGNLKYVSEVTKLGTSRVLGTSVYEIKHLGKKDPRVSISRETFNILRQQSQSRALVLFVPVDDSSNYRFSLITMTFKDDDKGNVSTDISNPRRYSYKLGEALAQSGSHTPKQFLEKGGRVANFKDLQERFSVEILTKAFYDQLSDWYAWALQVVKFPKKFESVEEEERFNKEAMIRLITRLIFVWFIKQKELVPDEFFDLNYIKDYLLKEIDVDHDSVLSKKSHYYKAILQNLFFAMLNCPITTDEDKNKIIRRFKTDTQYYINNDYNNKGVMRYKKFFKDANLFLELANKKVPFLNGGLFECLDGENSYVDFFTERTMFESKLAIPDFLFFGETVGRGLDLTDFYGKEKKSKSSVDVSGLVDILNQYNFTIEENTPIDQEVSLDPELLGKVFENLLASFNPETQSQARKNTGSYYTPREIVKYMVDESLVAYLKQTVDEDLEPEYRRLLSYTEQDANLSEEQKNKIMQALYDCKILDPACGSGAFPMGCLQQMVHVLTEIDPDNKVWKDILLKKALEEIDAAQTNEDKTEREKALANIENSFNENNVYPDYARKLYLIEHCIYGVDIQCIAIQISKLRFFISLVVDEKTNSDPFDNFGVRPLPNLEAKFVAANTLVGLNKHYGTIKSTRSYEVETQLKQVNHKIFNVRDRWEKLRLKKQVVRLRQELAKEMVTTGFLPDQDALMLASWDMFNQNTSSSFFDSDCMFGVDSGFDIVIGNPPYINTELIPKNDKELYQKNYSCFYKRADIFAVFIELALNTLSKNGAAVTFIVPSVVHSNLSYKKLRELILNNRWLREVCYTGGNVFKATVDTTILFLKKGNNKNIILKNAVNFEEPISQIVPNDYFSKFNNIISTSDGTTQGIYNKLMNVNLPILENGYTVFQGIVTGNNNAFIFESESDAISKGVDKTLLHPLCHGRDIDKFVVKNRERRILYVNSDIDITQYPSTQEWLLKFKDKLNERREVKRNVIKWYSLQWPRVKSELDLKEKILMQNTRNESLKTRIVATLDDCGCYASQGVNFIIPQSPTYNLHYLLGVLNSTVINYLFRTKFLNLAIKAEYLKQIHIPVPSKDKEQLISNLVDKILTAKLEAPDANTTREEQEIDKLVYHLYGLSYDEVLIVDPEAPISREEYESI